MAYYISGIQQMGIGVPDVNKMFAFYRKAFGNDIKIFEEAAQAPLMINYTGGTIHSRTATMAINMNGGGGFEIWQFTSRGTEKATFDIQLGDTGLFATRIKCKDVKAQFEDYKKKGIATLNEPCLTPGGEFHFFLHDPNGNLFEVVEGKDWFSNDKHLCGGVAGSMIGVSDIDKALSLYSGILGYDKVEYDVTGTFEDLNMIPGGNRKFRRVLLSHRDARKGPFSQLLGATRIELIQLTEEKGRKIFGNRYWGDWGFIHLCFDVRNMDELKSACEKAGYPFTVDSGSSFDMGEAAGRFSYIEDPDGTLIEFVETHKLPILKKLGWYLNLKKRNAEKALPHWMLRTLRFSRVKD
ncbi:MAG: VOC family protein [Flavobacteriales bacterium]|nr:VOC family protein [Flavobacteriales bacterium]